MITVTKSYIPPMECYESLLKEIWRTGQLTNNGPLCRQLSNEVAKYLGVENIELVSSGTIALQLALKALGIQGEVITTPFTYVATANAIAWESCQPVFVDIDSHTFCINPDLIERSITDKTSAILATHVYGYPCNLIKIRKIAKKYNLKIIYDAAACFGIKLNGESLLLHGDASILSFHATKLFHTAEGGAVICKSSNTLNKIGLMKKFGHIGEEDYLDIGINAKMSELHAAMGLSVLPEVANLITKRRICSEVYDQVLKKTSLQIPQIPDNLEYNYSYYPVVFASQKQLCNTRKILIENGIMPRRYFYPSLNRLSYLSKAKQVDCPVSESISESVLSLPLSHELELADAERIAKLIVGVIG